MVFFAGDAEPPATISAPSSRGLGRRPLKAVTPVRIRSGLHQPRSAEALTRESAGRSLVASAPGDAPPDPPGGALRPGRGGIAGSAGGCLAFGAIPALPVRPSPSGAVVPSANLRPALWPPARIPAWRCASQCYSYWCRGPRCHGPFGAGGHSARSGRRRQLTSVIWAGGEAVRASLGLLGKRCERHMGWRGSGARVTWAAGKRCRRHLGCRGHQRDMGLC
jgi:hypothetical protein